MQELTKKEKNIKYKMEDFVIDQSKNKDVFLGKGSFAKVY